MTDPLIEMADKHRANDAALLAAVHAVARKADALLSASDPHIHDIGADLHEIVGPALACVGEVRS